MTRRKQGFEVLDARFLRIADELFNEFDGTESAVNLQEIHRRILVRMKQEGVNDAHLPERLTQEYLSTRYAALGSTTRAHRSRSQRKASSTSSYPAVHPSHLVIDGTRIDNLVWDELQERVYSVEVLTVISVATRVVVALRVTPRSSSGIEAGLALYDAMRPFSMVVEGGNVDDFRWCGIPQSLDLGGNPVHLGRRPAVKAERKIEGVHHLPAVTPSSIRADHGSIFIGAHFRGLLKDFGIDLMLSRGSKPTDNPHVERWHETLQRACQQIPGHKGRGVYERGRLVGLQADEPLLTAGELEQHLRRFVALDYHRSPHRGLKLPGAPEARLTPLEMWDAMMDATGRIHVPQHPDLIYQFLPLRWLTVRHDGVTYKGLTYDDKTLDDFRTLRVGAFRSADDKAPFHYDPRDVSKVWFRHPESGRIHEIAWRGSHLIHAPMADVIRDRAIARIKERGGNKTLGRKTTMHEIINEVTELTAKPDIEEWRAQNSAARLRWEQSRIDHAEAAEAARYLENLQADSLPRVSRREAEASPTDVSADDEPWPDYESEAI